MLAKSIWPRSGGCQSNRAHISVSGPPKGIIAHRLKLPYFQSETIAGGAVAEDGTLRVVCGGYLTAIAPDHQMLWSIRLHDHEIKEFDLDDDSESENIPDEEEPSKPDRLYNSLPCVIDKTDTLVTLQRTAVVIDGNGALIRKTGLPLADDSGLSPNVDHSGIPILTTIHGDIMLWHRQTKVEISHFGYDIVPVAMFDDNSFGVSGYYGTGYCRVRGNGDILWRSALKEADMLPTINAAQISAVGGANEGKSLFISPQGETMAVYPQQAVFSVHPSGWIALTKDHVALLSPEAEVTWSRPLQRNLRWGSYQAIVDQRGHVYACDHNRVVAFDPQGNEQFQVFTGSQPGPLFPVREQLMGTVVGQELLYIA